MIYHGVLPVFKPKGYTSHDIVGQIRRLTGQKKVGHTGTLDPEVEGVLPICLGQATRIVEYVQDLPKRYRGSFVLGISTDTQDQTGTVLERVPVNGVNQALVENVFTQFHGIIHQVPPMYSAVKVNGRRLYDLARAGQVVERPSRPVTIYQLSCTAYKNSEFPEVEFDVICSKGTYVRTLCVDIGQALGYPAHMTSLIRTESGPFQLEDCFPLDVLKKVSEEKRWHEVLTAIDEVLGQFPSMIVSEADLSRVLNGWSLELGEEHPYVVDSIVRVYTETGRFCALYRIDAEGLAKPEKVFQDVEN